MINALVVVGNNIKYNAPFMEYVERKVCERLGHLDAIYHLDKNDSDLFLSIEEIIHKSKYIMIVTRDAYSLVSKILCTLTQDNMLVKEGVLAPSKADYFAQDSYLLSYHDSVINVIKVHEKETLPPIMISPKESGVGFFLVDATSEKEQEQLKNIVKINDVSISQTALIDGLVYVKATGFKHAQYEGFIQALAFGFPDKVLFGDDLSAIIAERLIACGKHVTCAESCTGGLIASEIVKNAGVSAIFDGSIVSYADGVKKEALGVKALTLGTHGAVSMQTVYEMLEGALVFMGADMAIAVSGIAGPTGGSKEKPVGRVFIGAKSKNAEAFVEKLDLKGDRIYIQKQAMFWGLKLLLLSDKKTFFNFLPKKLDN
jgi:nicotinamide-nucleotide amidase